MISCEKFDVYRGEQIYKYTLTDKISVEVVTLGATLLAIRVPNSAHTQTDVLLGLTNSADIAASQAYMGSVVGRCANRIAYGKFTLDGKQYQLAQNNGKNHLHGGVVGFNQKVYKAQVQGDSLVLSCESPDGEENYPSNLNFTVQYTVKGSTLIIDYFAETDGKTLFNPTNHAYFNLDGGADIYGNVLQIFADAYLPIDGNLIPTGEIRPVLGTAFDFSEPKEIGKDIGAADEQLLTAGGYDHNFCLSGEHAARAYSPKTGIVMDCFTDRPGVQFYTGNFLNERGKATYNRRAGFCLETQCYPDAINHPDWLQPIVEKGKKFHSQTRYEFSVK